jgi:hypothetical protein
LRRPQFRVNARIIKNNNIFTFQTTNTLTS